MKHRWKDSRIFYSLLAIVLGFVVGAIVLMIAGINPIEAYALVFKGIFGKPKNIAFTVVKSTPLIFTGLSVAFAFRTGLFNIGAEGQFIIGSLAAALVGHFVHLPALLHIPLTLLAGMAAAGLWAAIAGYLKARFEVNEVISTIMLNWIALYLMNFMVYQPAFKAANSDFSKPIAPTAWIDADFFGNVTGSASTNWGIVIALVTAVLLYLLIFRTTWGYDLRAVGYNKDAAQYAGIDIKRSILISMVISGVLAGMGGAIEVMGVNHTVAIANMPRGYGFNGIAVALIGNNSPFGILLSAFLFGGLEYGSSKLQLINAPSEVISILIGTVIWFVASVNALRIVFNTFKGGLKRGKPAR